MRSADREPPDTVTRNLPALLERAAGVEVVSELGRGARTVVYRVRRGGAEYALKTLSGDVGPGDLAAFRREGAMLASIQHPGLVATHEVGDAAGRPYLLMDLVGGEPLGRLLEAGPLGVERLVEVALHVTGGLSAAHRAGLVHRDVKPSNIVIRADGSAVLIDFGLAGRLRPGEDASVSSDVVVGTLAYASPEQSGMLRRPVDGRSDLYSLGVVLHECLTGERPFHATDVGELLRLHAIAPVPDLARDRPDLPACLVRVIEKLLAKDPDDRYQSGEGLEHDLRLVLGGSPLHEGPGRSDRPVETDRPLVGRATELEILSSRWREARQGHGLAVLVRGPAGSGKSRLVRELLATASPDGAAVLLGKAAADTAVPLAALRAAVEQYLTDLLVRDRRHRDDTIARLRRETGSAAGLLAALSPQAAKMLEADGPAPDDRPEQFATAVAVFLAAIARIEGGAVLVLDDVQWLDEVTHRVLNRLAGELPGTPLLVVGAGRDDPDSESALAAFRTSLGDTVVDDVTLSALDEAAVSRLVTNEMGGAHLPDEVTRQLGRRAGGNPFSVREYLRAVLDAGLLRPSWGRWLLDVDGLDGLALSSNSLEVMAARVGALPGHLVPPLQAAAAVGSRFPAGLVARVCRMSEQDLWTWLDEAGRQGLIEHRAGDDYVFLHDRIREAVLAGLTPDALADLHQHIAETLDASPSDDPAWGYAVARHGLLGRVDRAPRWLIERCLDAGRRALVDHAPAEALAFLRPLPDLAAAAGIELGADAHEQLGVALHRVGRAQESVAALSTALTLTPPADRLERAHLHSLIAQAHVWTWNVPAALDAVAAALGELRCPFPKHPLRLVGSALVRTALAPPATLVRRLLGPPSGRRLRRLRLQARLYVLAGDVMWLCYRPDAQALFTLLALPAGNRVGTCEEYVRIQRSLGASVEPAFNRSGARWRRRAREAADELGDPGLVAEVAAYAAFIRVAAGGSFTDDHYLDVLTDHRRWLDVGLHVNLIAALVCEELALGRPQAALEWHVQGQDRLGGDYSESHPFSFLGVPIAAQAGRVEEAQQRLDAARSAPGVDHPGGEQNLLCLDETIALTELGDHGPDFDRATTGFTSLVPRPKWIIPSNRVFYVFQAYGRVAAYRAGQADDRERLREAATKAVAELGTLANRPVLRPHHYAARADLRLLDGDPAAALDDAARAEDLALRADVPLALYEVARVRARALAAIGRHGQARHQARLALLLALQNGWALRAQWVRAEFALADPVGATASRSRDVRSTSDAPWSELP